MKSYSACGLAGVVRAKSIHTIILLTSRASLFIQNFRTLVLGLHLFHCKPQGRVIQFLNARRT
jgi:hypothetical protein